MQRLRNLNGQWEGVRRIVRTVVSAIRSCRVGRRQVLCTRTGLAGTVAHRHNTEAKQSEVATQTTDLVGCRTHSPATIPRTKTLNRMLTDKEGMAISGRADKTDNIASRAGRPTIGSTVSRHFQRTKITDSMGNNRDNTMDMASTTRTVSSRDKLAGINKRISTTRIKLAMIKTREITGLSHRRTEQTTTGGH